MTDELSKPKRKPGARESYLRWRREQGMAYACDTPGCALSDPAEVERRNAALEVHHINGVNCDDTRDNQQLLCKDCHRATPNYGARNRNMAHVVVPEVYRVGKQDGAYNYIGKTQSAPFSLTGIDVEFKTDQPPDKPA